MNVHTTFINSWAPDTGGELIDPATDLLLRKTDWFFLNHIKWLN